jgi:hypothetical protein
MPGRWIEERERDWQDWRVDTDWHDRERDRDRWRDNEQRATGREDRVFGERESGAEYNRPRTDDWQQRRYDRGPRFTNQDYTRGGRFYGDDARARIHREEYGQGGHDDGRRFGSREADER